MPKVCNIDVFDEDGKHLFAVQTFGRGQAEAEGKMERRLDQIPEAASALGEGRAFKTYEFVDEEEVPDIADYETEEDPDDECENEEE